MWMISQKGLAPFLLGFIALSFSTTVYGGPDHHILFQCADLYTRLNVDQRHAVRDVVQALQAVESYLGLLGVGRPLPVSPVPEASPNATVLEMWKADNMTKLLTLMENTATVLHLGSRENAVALARSCLPDRLHPDGFAGRPVVSIILNYFKRPSVVPRICANMRSSCAAAGVPCELVINVDNPHEAAAWAAEAAAAPGFVVPVFSANLHEARGYNRAARLARGRYLIVWQDDQVPPMSGQWLVDMIKVFDAYPQLGILGMNTHRLCKHWEPTNRWGWSLWKPDKKTGVRWTFAQTVDFAPLAIRASIFRTIGGLDESLARPGECGIWGDWELCLRAWMDGWQVGYMNVEGRSGDGNPGTTHVGANGEKCWGRQQQVASTVFHHRYGAQWLQDLLCGRVWTLNMLTFETEPGICPYGTPDTKYGNCTQLSADRRASAEAEFSALATAARARGAGVWSAPDKLAGLLVSGAGVEVAGPARDTGADASGGLIEINPVLVRGGFRRRLL